MQCLSCTASAPDGSRFCPSCGRPLVDADAVTRLAQPVSPAFDVTRLPTSALDVTALPTGGVEVADTPIEAGALLGGRYRIQRLLGRGGMGAVYLADDLRLKQPVALKLLPRSLARDPKRLAQFHNEVSLARQISHPHVCRVYDITEIEGRLFLSMEYIEGEDLAAALRRRGALPEPEAVELSRQICFGLAAVHARGILHRDLKPSNIMLNARGQAQLMDFGIATAGQVDDSREGTPAYMAPEHLLGESASVQSDVYALGLIMFELFTGSRVFDSHTPLDVLVRQHASTTVTGRPELAAIANARLREAILRCLDRDPSRRPQSAQAVAVMLQRVLLDATTVWRRLVQIVLQLIPVLAGMFGLSFMMRAGGSGLTTGLALLGVAAVATIASLKFPIGWTVPYKGHRIAFRNHPIFGERLYIDGTLVDRGRVGFAVTLRGTIESGDGAGERITADVQCSFVRISCRIVAEAFQ